MTLEEIGILKYGTASEGISGTIKSTPEDFLVEEVWESGVVEAKNFRGKGIESGKAEGQDAQISGSGDYTHFTLEKNDWDINKVLKYLGNFCGVSKKRFDYSGTKDKFAVTSQRISAWKVPAERLSAFKTRDVYLYDFELKEDGMELGDHTGNKFEVVLRDVGSGAEALLKKFEKEAINIPNWFGPQRFGGRLNSHLVGKEIMKGNLEEAVRIYLCSEGDKNEAAAEARAWLKENWGEFKEALDRFPDGLRYERSIMHHLAVYPNDYANAIRQLPRGIFKIFVHAYQSYLFNLVVSERLKEGCEAGGLGESGLGEIDGDILEDGVPTGPVFGYDCKLAGGKAGEIERKALKDAGIKQEDFRIKSVPEASGKGIRRKLAIGVKDFGYKIDKENIVLNFVLPPGAYATSLLIELLKKNYAKAVIH